MFQHQPIEQKKVKVETFDKTLQVIHSKKEVSKMERFVAIWLKRDFRLHDNHALFKTIEYCKQTNSKWVMFVHLTKEQLTRHTFENEYYLYTIAQFKKRMETNQMTVHLLSGSEEDVITSLKKSYPTLSHIYTNTNEVGDEALREERLKTAAITQGISFYSLLDSHLHYANEVKKKDGTFYKVYTPYYKMWRTLKKPSIYKCNHAEIKFYAHVAPPMDVKTETLFYTFLNEIKKITFPVGEEKAVQLFQQFLKEDLPTYSKKRNEPYWDATSHMSPFLKVGAISVRSMYHVVKQVLDETGSKEAEAFIKELAWREFFQMIYYYYPHSAEEEVQEKYRQLKWKRDEEQFERWKEGKTGFPFVDAGMRQLKEEGWMHNRLRMVVASFLTKDYLLDWRLGEKYFKEMLIDYEPSQNIGNWQWAASVGMDAVPYFRIFNPITQGEKFDKSGEYIRKYVKELQDVDVTYLHTPFKMSKSEQKKSSCTIGIDYPYPTVNHKVQREKALAFYRFELC